MVLGHRPGVVPSPVEGRSAAFTPYGAAPNIGRVDTKLRPFAIALALCVAACGQVRVVTQEEISESRGSSLDRPTNVGFEEVRERGLPKAWRVTQFSGGYGAATDERVKRSGRRSARLTFTGTGDAAEAAFNQDLEGRLYAGKTLTVSAWIRTRGTEICQMCRKPGLDERRLSEDPRRGAQVRVLAYTTGDAGVSETLVTPMVMGNKGWTRFVARTQVPPTAYLVIIAPILWGRGTAWFDDVVVTAD